MKPIKIINQREIHNSIYNVVDETVYRQTLYVLNDTFILSLSLFLSTKANKSKPFNIFKLLYIFIAIEKTKNYLNILLIIN